MSEKILSEESLTEIYEKCDSYAKEVAVTGGTNNVRILIRNIRQLRTENAELRKELENEQRLRKIYELAKDGLKWRENINKKIWPRPLTPEEEASMPEDMDDD